MRRSSVTVFVAIFGMAAPASGAMPDTWYPVESPTAETLNDVDFAEDGSGFAVGDNGTVLHYDQSAWQIVPFPFERPMFAIVAASGRDDAWVFPRMSSQVYHYVSGQWETVALDREFRCMAVDFPRRDLGYAVGLFGMAYHYDGKRWNRVNAPALTTDRETHLRGVAVLADDDVWVGAEQFLVHWSGHQWARVPLPTEASNGHIQRVDNTLALIIGRVLLREGERWNLLLSKSAVVVARAPNGALWAIVQDKLGMQLQDLSPNGATFSVPGRSLFQVARGKDGLWAVGEKGLILHLEPQVLPSFVDRTFDAGAGVQAASEFGLLVDLDGSGPRDLLLAKPFGRNSFLRGEEKGTFRSHPLEYPTLAELPNASNLAAADVDGDGWIDLVLRMAYPPEKKSTRIFRNMGAFRFWDIPLPPGSPGANEDHERGDVIVADLDGDTDLDVYEVRTHTQVGAFPLPNVLYRNDGFGHFIAEVLGQRDGGAAWAWSNTALAADLTGDGRTDLMSLNAWGDGNAFYIQNADGTLSDVTAESGLEGDVHEGRAIAAGDIDNDGDLDVLALTSLDFGPSRLYRNDGSGHFHDTTSESGLDRLVVSAARVEFADMDLDGDLDLVLGNALVRGAKEPENGRLRLLINDGRGHFLDATVKAGIDQTASSIIVDDFDDDGDVDLYLVRSGDSNRLLLNEPPKHGFLKVRLESPAPNRNALGSKVSIFGPDGKLAGFRETNWAAPVAHFGMGTLAAATVEVRFPSGRVVRREVKAPNAEITISEVAWPIMYMRNGWFFLLHRWAWTDKKRDAASLLITLSFLAGLWRLSKWLETRFFVRRPKVIAVLFGVFFVTRLGWMHLEPVSVFARIFPFSAMMLSGLLLLAWDRHVTRRADTRFVGGYELLSELGRGGMGIVYKARDTSLPDRPIVALKVLRPDRVKDPASMRRFIRESEIGSRLSHPGIVSVLASGECRVFEGGFWRSTAYLAMEFVDATPFADLLADADRLPLVRRLEIVRDAALALDVAHAMGILHRDIKPDNILLSRAGVVKLADFGIAATLAAPSHTEVGLIVGTLAYLPPERAAGRGEDARGDLYALGVVLYEAIYGRRPFDTPDTGALLSAILTREPPLPESSQANLPRILIDLVRSLLAKDPAKRPASAQLVADRIDAAIRELRGEVMTFAPIANAPAAVAEEVPRSPAARAAPVENPFDRETLDLPIAPPVRNDSVQRAFDRETLDLPSPNVSDKKDALD